jgi:hypothetical protein
MSQLATANKRLQQVLPPFSLIRIYDVALMHTPNFAFHLSFASPQKERIKDKEKAPKIERLNE